MSTGASSDFLKRWLKSCAFIGGICLFALGFSLVLLGAGWLVAHFISDSPFVVFPVMAFLVTVVLGLILAFDD